MATTTPAQKFRAGVGRRAVLICACALLGALVAPTAAYTDLDLLEYAPLDGSHTRDGHVGATLHSRWQGVPRVRRADATYDAHSQNTDETPDAHLAPAPRIAVDALLPGVMPDGVSHTHNALLPYFALFVNLDLLQLAEQERICRVNATATNCTVAINNASSVLDASQIYGVNAADHAQIRTGTDGTIRTLHTGALEHLTRCQGLACVLATHVQSSTRGLVTAFKLIFEREHNRWCRTLKHAFPSWGDQELFDEARKHVIAVLQSVTYGELLPALLGETCPRMDGNSLDTGTEYMPEDDSAQVGPEYVAAADLLMATVPQRVERRAVRDRRVARDAEVHDLLENLLDNTTITIEEVATLILGATYQPANLFMGEASNSAISRFDIVESAIERARALGVVPYNQLRRAYGLDTAADFDEVTTDGRIAYLLRTSYGANIEELDAFVGAAAEEPIRGSIFGETLSRVICGTFARLRKNDPLHYESGAHFNASELGRLHRISLGNILRANVPELASINLNRVFYLPEPQNTEAVNVDCVVSEWMTTGPCSHYCGGGSRPQVRKVLRAPRGAGLPCPELRRAVGCNLKRCTDDDLSNISATRSCVVGFWANYGPCLNGSQVQGRPVLRPPTTGVDDCPDVERRISCTDNMLTAAELEEADDDAQLLEPTEEPDEDENEEDEGETEPETCVMSDWSELSPCSRSCGGGVQMQQRTIISRPSYKTKCPSLVKVMQCNLHPCASTPPTAGVGTTTSTDDAVVLQGRRQQACSDLAHGATCSWLTENEMQRCSVSCSNGTLSAAACITVQNENKDLSEAENGSGDSGSQVGGDDARGKYGTITAMLVGVALVIGLLAAAYTWHRHRNSARQELSSSLASSTLTMLSDPTMLDPVAPMTAPTNAGLSPPGRLKRRTSDLLPVGEHESMGDFDTEPEASTATAVRAPAGPGLHGRHGYERRASLKYIGGLENPQSEA
ncbi:uncharacterized protein MONBRDRAFT_26049 [Monosiga brevicollis MX1]|uniref:Spondin-like TSP1 domain-containing protein n=1 Tax=Monosiga brevicollis TaxID=81824 RepID=A9V180_MONBE|nr:uncharacterized protein MONBRDRAFT_26049 [Monosiga brevicollis MX1]EDQ88762.1 predicted protein [Monosiga brevicollis MX1]|eukprot:XP_001746375.1 hypothetical protein [Monosiga brevicollis MX1]